MKKKLTDALLRDLKRSPPEKRQTISDSELRGLMIRISPTGHISFSVQYRVTDGVVRETLGTWQRDLSLKEARDQAYAKMATRKGKSRLTMRDLFPEYMEASREALRPRSVQSKDMRFRVHLLPALGDVPLCNITRVMINDVLDDIKKKQRSAEGHTIGGVGSARDARRQLSAFFNWCIDRGHLTGNPMAGMRRTDLSQKLNTGKVASDHHVKYYWLAAEQAAAEGRAYGIIAQLVMLTACRRTEITELTWPEVDLKARVIEFDPERYKTGISFTVPLVDTAVQLLQRQLRLQLEGPYVFSGQGMDGYVAYTGWNKAGPSLASRANELYMKREKSETPLSYIRPNHDWRVTIASRLTEMGYTAELADRILGHLRPAIERTYNKYDFLEERRAALGAWEEFVLGLNKRQTPKNKRLALMEHLMEERGKGYVEPANPEDWKPGTWEQRDGR